MESKRKRAEDTGYAGTEKHGRLRGERNTDNIRDVWQSVRNTERTLRSPEGQGQDEAYGNPLHLLRHPHGKRSSTGGQDRTNGAFDGCLTRKLSVDAEHCILAMKNGQKIRSKRPEIDIKLKF